MLFVSFSSEDAKVADKYPEADSGLYIDHKNHKDNPFLMLDMADISYKKYFIQAWIQDC
jgi:hypothetical protein